MGSAYYYMKVKFPSGSAALKAKPKIDKFFTEVSEAYDYWQDNRHGDPKPFWAGMKKKYPQTYDYLSNMGLVGKDINNGLAGLLSFGKEADKLRVRGDEVWYMEDTWHFADWGPLRDYLMLRFKASDAKWISDEYIEPFDLISFERN